MKKSYFLKCFNLAYTKIPAYKNYLSEANIDPLSIVDFKNFKKLPLQDKKSYILNHPLATLFPDGKIPAMGHSSSGSSGIPTLWFRGDKQTKMGSKIHAQIFNDIFNIQKDEPTLVLICFAMGVWVAGTYTLMACYDMSRKGYQITTFSVGMDPDAVCTILKQSISFFKNIILFGYPFFIDVIFEALLKQEVPITENFFIITSGDKFSEDWRKNILNKISQPINQSKRVLSIYGCSDAGALGHETPLSIFIRQETLQNSKLYTEIFGNSVSGILPTLVQYNPQSVFFEEEKGELVLTADLDCPLVRYNMHDRGKVISFAKMKKLLLLLGSKQLVKNMMNTTWKLPFLVVDLKTDVAVVFEAVKIFPEQIKAGINDPKISKFLSGSFTAYTKENSKKETRLHFDLELAVGLKEISEVIKQDILNCIFNQLKLSNTEYRVFNASMPHLTLPIITFHSYGAEEFKNNALKNQAYSAIVSLMGKKSKVII